MQQKLRWHSNRWIWLVLIQGDWKKYIKILSFIHYLACFSSTQESPKGERVSDTGKNILHTQPLRLYMYIHK